MEPRPGGERSRFGLAIAFENQLHFGVLGEVKLRERLEHAVFINRVNRCLHDNLGSIGRGQVEVPKRELPSQSILLEMVEEICKKLQSDAGLPS